jgi:hypothetical protein
MVREEPGDSHPIVNEWGGGLWVPGQVRVVPRPGMGNLQTHTILSHIFFMSPKLSLTLACLKFI